MPHETHGLASQWGWVPSEPAALAHGATLVVLGAVSLFLLDGWDAVFAVVAVPTLVGACLGVCSATRREAAAAGLLSAVIGTVLAIALYPWIPTLVGSPTVAAEFSAGRVALPALCAVILMPSVAWAVAALLERLPQAGFPRRAVSWCLVGVIAVSFLGTMSGPANRWGSVANPEPAAGSYSTDQMLNLKTYHLMRRGENFYDAYVHAHADDKRQLYPVTDGKFESVSPAMLRQPTMFYLWRSVAADGDLRRVAYLSLLLAAVVLVAIYWSTQVAVGERALFMAIFVLPLLATHANGLNTLLPEWWALLALLGGFCALVRGRPMAAGLLGLVAVTFRETFGVWLLALAIAAALVALRDRRAWRWVATYLGLLVVGFAVFLRHVVDATRYVIRPAGSSVVTYLLHAGAGSVGHRLGAPLEYLMLGYGSSLVSPMWLVLTGMAGLWVGLRGQTPARLAAVVYVMIFLGYFAVLGVAGPYWGQAVTALLVIGTGLLLASIDRLALRGSWELCLDGARWGTSRTSRLE